ncbi:MAG: mobile mystery protein A [Ignavibacteriae bacterium]|nr:mobile mystery protein A [Ignavibacteriota bacterium]
MKKTNKKLLIQQLDKKLKLFSSLRNLDLPPEGWMYSIRTALGLSLKQVGKRLGLSASGVKEMERREKNSSLTLKNLQEFGNVLNMKFIYGFIPADESLERMIDKQAAEVAKKIVLRTSHNMKLEDQEVSNERIQRAIMEKADEIKKEMPRNLWD